MCEKVEFAELPNGDKVPCYLYRYMPINDKLFASIERGYQWFSDPLGFNDPYDCRLPFTNNIHSETIEAYEKIVCKMQLPNATPEEVQTRVKYYQGQQDEFAFELNKERNDLVSVMGICCFSESKENMPMWWNYADKRKGICLKFDARKDKDFFSVGKLTKLHYVDNPPNFDFVSYVIENNGIAPDGALRQFLVGYKEKHWSGEEEVRVVKWKNFHGNFRGEVSFRKECLVGVCFGDECGEEAESVLAAFDKNGYHLHERMKGKLKQGGFGLDFISL